jgi:NOL1/NOP2/fmu family ribosome biogenesis protein
MGKKRTRKAKSSKGLRPSINPGLVQAVRAERTHAEVATAKTEAWRAGKNPWITVANSNKNETNRLFYRVKANSYFGGTFKDIKNRVKREREGAVN